MKNIPELKDLGIRYIDARKLASMLYKKLGIIPIEEMLKCLNIKIERPTIVRDYTTEYDNLFTISIGESQNIIIKIGNNKSFKNTFPIIPAYTAMYFYSTMVEEGKRYEPKDYRFAWPSVEVEARMKNDMDIHKLNKFISCFKDLYNAREDFTPEFQDMSIIANCILPKYGTLDAEEIIKQMGINVILGDNSTCVDKRGDSSFILDIPNHTITTAVDKKHIKYVYAYIIYLMEMLSGEYEIKHMTGENSYMLKRLKDIKGIHKFTIWHEINSNIYPYDYYYIHETTSLHKSFLIKVFYNLLEEQRTKVVVDELDFLRKTR